MRPPSSDQPPLLDYSNLKHPRLDGGGMREGKFLVVNADITLPQRCIRCNAPANEPPLHCDIRGERAFEITLTERKVRVQYFLCHKHLRRQNGIKIATIISATTVLFSVPCIIYLKTHYAWPNDFQWITNFLYIASIIFVGIILLLGTDGLRKPRRHKIRKNLIYIAGVSTAFLNNFPSISKP